MKRLKLAELISSLSHALDITEGQPEGHCVRCCWIGMHIGREYGLPEDQLWSLYYTLLLKDLGCSSNAARICELYLTDDLSFKRDFKTMGDSLPKVLNFVLKHTGLRAGLAERFRSVLTIIRDGQEIARELIATRCHRGAEIARLLRFPQDVSDGIFSLDEHFSGQGKPAGLSGESIPIYSRIALLAQVLDVFNTQGGKEEALDEIRERSGTWFDPQLVEIALKVSASNEFWEVLDSPDVTEQILRLEPAGKVVELDDDYLDDIAAAFGQVVDSKSPYTSGHSERVALYTDMIAEEMGIEPERRRWLKRGALLHDVGKLGVSNSILDKPGKLDDEEWKAVQMHATYTETILSRIDAFDELARVAASHHERLDGKGYPRGLTAESICLETRIITTADIFDAITAERPYRGAIPIPKTLEMMAENALAGLAEKRDNETGNHLYRTQAYIEALMTHLADHPRFKAQLTPAQQILISKAAPLHDIGKVGIPDAILLKPGRLTAEEFEIMKQHSRIGADAISEAIERVLAREEEAGLSQDAGAPLAFLEVARQIALFHHEKWDGSGYPNGLDGENIPLPGRLMAIADVFDALSCKRHYKDAFSADKTRSILIEGKGTHFDPDLVDAFLDLESRFIEIAQHYHDQP